MGLGLGAGAGAGAGAEVRVSSLRFARATEARLGCVILIDHRLRPVEGTSCVGRRSFGPFRRGFGPFRSYCDNP